MTEDPIRVAYTKNNGCKLLKSWEGCGHLNTFSSKAPKQGQPQEDDLGSMVLRLSKGQVHPAEEVISHNQTLEWSRTSGVSLAEVGGSDTLSSFPSFSPSVCSINSAGLFSCETPMVTRWLSTQTSQKRHQHPVTQTPLPPHLPLRCALGLLTI